MKLSKLLIGYIEKRVIDDIALLPLDNKSKFEKKDTIEWIEEFRNLDKETLDFIIELVYNQQASYIDSACNNCIDYIKIPGLGSLRLNKSRHEILKTILVNGKIEQSEVQAIINKNIAIKNNGRKDVFIDTKVL